jgi:hypothetical protein
MLELIKKFSALLLLACLVFPGCSSFSKQGRQQAAYRNHVRKIQNDHKKQLAKATKKANRPLSKAMTPSAPKVSVSLDAGDAGSASSDSGQN